MNENSKPKGQTLINEWLRGAAEELAMLGIPTALLDAEVILAHTLRKSRTYLHAHGEQIIDPRRLEIANARLDLRKDRVPVAYIIGHKEFYGRIFKVTPAVLIPRPESEAIITQLKGLVGPNKPLKLVDIGTGSGCLGITAKLELPSLSVTLSDNSQHALTVAKENASSLNAEVKLVHSDLFEKLKLPFDIILANLPYVDKTWERSPETNHEPAEALFASSNGRALIERLLNQAPAHLNSGGHLLIEADPEQHAALTDHAKNRGLIRTAVDGYCLVFKKH